MKRCSICGKEITGNEGNHPSCIRNLFGVDFSPQIDLSLGEISLKAQEMVGKFSISGVQAKLSIKLNNETKSLEVTAQSGEYILKPQTAIFPDIPQNENLCMNIASNVGIEIPPHILVKLKDGSFAYVIKRFDRVKGEKLHQEDFAQILGTAKKYEGSIERIAKTLRRISDMPGLDLQFLFERILLNFIIGNGDAHLKNFSIVHKPDGSVRLSPAYDIVSSKLVLPSEEDTALTINGKKNNIKRSDFDIFADTLEINTVEIFNNFLGRIDLICDLIKDSYLNENDKQKLTEIVHERISRLKVVTQS